MIEVKLRDEHYISVGAILLFLQMVALLHNKFQSLIEKFYIIDCRYPYEYHGGHIKVRDSS